MNFTSDLPLVLIPKLLTEKRKIFKWLIFEYFYALTTARLIFGHLRDRIQLGDLILRSRREETDLFLIRIHFMTYDNDFIIR